jgi:hypothetical protein
MENMLRLFVDHSQSNWVQLPVVPLVWFAITLGTAIFRYGTL